jgi:hypothetical protein
MRCMGKIHSKEDRLAPFSQIVGSGNIKGGSITVLLTSCLTGLESDVSQLTIFVFICKTH